jgi:hypothetical protein
LSQGGLLGYDSPVLLLRADELVLTADLDYVVLGLMCFLIAGIFMILSIGRGRPRTRAQFVLGVSAESLSGLRASIMAKGRSLCSAIFFVIGTTFLLGAFLLPGEASPSVQYWGSGVLLVIAGLLLFLLDGHVRRVMRSHLRHELKTQAFAFEDHIGLAREIGELFEIEPKQGETLESFVRSVRKAVGVPDSPRGGGGYGMRR